MEWAFVEVPADLPQCIALGMVQGLAWPFLDLPRGVWGQSLRPYSIKFGQDHSHFIQRNKRRHDIQTEKRQHCIKKSHTAVEGRG